MEAARRALASSATGFSTGNPRLEPVAAAAGARLACAMAALSATDQRTAGYDAASASTS